MRKKRTAKFTSVLGLLGMAIFLGAQSQASRSDADQIVGLMTGLSDHSKAPADVLDPKIEPSARSKNLQRFSAPDYELSIVPTGSAPAISRDAASVPVRVHFDSRDGNSLDVSTTAHFIRRNGTWYFANFDFMRWPVLLVVVFVICILFGIGYAVMVLVLRSKLVKEGRLEVKMFIPLFWPSLFRKAA